MCPSIRANHEQAPGAGWPRRRPDASGGGTFGRPTGRRPIRRPPEASMMDSQTTEIEAMAERLRELQRSHGRLPSGLRRWKRAGGCALALLGVALMAGAAYRLAQTVK